MITVSDAFDIKFLPYLHTNNGIIEDIGYAFSDFTGFTKTDVLQKDIFEVLNGLLRVKCDIKHLYSDQNKSSFYLFTKSLNIREVNIIVKQGLNANEKIYIILEKPNSRLDEKLIFVEQLLNDNIIGCAIYNVPDLILLKANQQYLDFMDAPYNRMENSIGKTIREIVTGFEGTQAEVIWDTILETQKPSYVKENRHDQFSRGVTYWDSTQTPVFEQGKMKYIIETAAEVTERVLARQEIEEQTKINLEQNMQLKKQNEMYNWQANLLNLSNEAILAWDLNGTIIYWNKGAERMYGYSNEEVVGHVRHDLLKAVPEDRIDEIKSILARDGAWCGEIEHTHKDGKRLIVETRKQLISNELGHQIVLETNRDISERKMAEEKIYWNKQRAEILWEVAGKLLESSQPQEIVEELCLKVIDFLDCHAFFNYIIDEEKSQLCLNAYAGIPKEAAEEIEWIDYGVAVCGCVARDGCRIVAENIQETSDIRTNFVKSFGIRAYACYPLIEQHKVIGTLSFGTKTRDNFSEDELGLMKAVADQVAIAMNRVRSEQVLRKQQQLMINAEKEKSEALKKAIEMKDEFLSLISHEFKTPLTVINSAIQAMELICRNELSDKAKGFLNKIRQNSNRQLKLVNNLLDITRMNAGRLKVVKKNTDIVFLTRSITESIRIFAEQKSNKLFFSSTLVKKVIGIDDEKYERILLNLLSNAVKFTPEGKSITVRLSQKTVKGKCKVCIQVSDEGVGIPHDKMNLIFERFGQVESSLTRQAEGTGIGLHLVKMLVEIMDGEIILESKEGVGSTFTILLPAEKVKEEQNKQVQKDISDNRLIQATVIEFSDVCL